MSDTGVAAQIPSPGAKCSAWRENVIYSNEPVSQTHKPSGLISLLHPTTPGNSRLTTGNGAGFRRVMEYPLNSNFTQVQYSEVECSTVSAVSVNKPYCSTVQFSAVQCSSVQYSAVQCSSVQYSAVQCNTLQFSAVQCNTVQFSAMQCSSVQYIAFRCNTVQFSALQFSAR